MTSHPKIIAHRGGVVGDEYAENSPGAVAAAIERGYWMIEVDVRESRDGRLVVNHDPDFTKFYGDPRQVSDLTWDEIARLRADPGGTRPLLFHELAELAAGHLGLMLDTKQQPQTEAYWLAIEQVLRDHDLLATAYFIDAPQPDRWTGVGAKAGLKLEALLAAADRGEDVAALYFLFEHGRDLTAERVTRAQALGVPVVPSINIYHYRDLDDHMAAAEADTRRMLDLGVEQFQIDSPYDIWLR